jgi:SIR2-like domain
MTAKEEKMTAKNAELGNRGFVDELVAEVRKGFGLAPFLGSGCSSSSGILMGQQFSEYLAWTVFLCVAQSEDLKMVRRSRRWNLRTQGWPEPAEPNEMRTTRRWARREFQQIARNCEFTVWCEQGSGIKIRLPLCKTRAFMLGGLAALHGVPRLPSILREHQGAGSWLSDAQSFKQLQEAVQKGLPHGGLPRAGLSPTSEDAIIERAIRSLFDWRATLQFIASLELDPPDHIVVRPRPDPTLIDEFSAHITRGRRPNLVHTMLGHLRQAARLRTIFTTNFDTLIEDAFAEQHRRIDVISVGRRGRLPSPNIVHGRDTVIKLHGTLSETRADFSLEEPPKPEDCRSFFHCLRGRGPLVREHGFVPAQLLVAGYSGSDPRCVQLIKYVLDHDRDAKVFWVCHSIEDQERLRRLFSEQSYSNQRQLISTVTERFDLLLYEFHQRLCLCLPPGGAAYPLNHSVPPEPNPLARPESIPGVNELLDALGAPADPESPADQIGAEIAPPQRAQGKGKQESPASFHAVIVDGTADVLPAMSAAYHSGRLRGYDKVWLELEDFRNTESVAHELFQTMAIRRGIFRLGHVELCPRPTRQEPIGSWHQHLTTLQRALGIDPKRWLIVLYGRNGAGTCSGWMESEWATAGWHPDEWTSWQKFLSALRENGFRLLYAPYTPGVAECDRQLEGSVAEAVAQELARSAPNDQEEEGRKHAFGSDEFDSMCTQHQPAGHRASWDDWSRVTLDQGGDPKSEFRRRLDAVAQATRADGEDARPGTWRMEAIYAASLFRQSRHPTAWLSEGVIRALRPFNTSGLDNDLERHATLLKWHAELSSNATLFYYKPGGFTWTYQTVRLGIRKLVEELAISSQRSSGRGDASDRFDDTLEDCAPRAHFFIGDWYLRAFHASGHATSLMEAAHHFYQCARYADLAKNSKSAAFKRYWWLMGTYELIRALRCGQSSLASWFGRGQIQEWFGRTARNKVIAALGTPKLEWKKPVISMLEAELLCLDGVDLADTVAWDPNNNDDLRYYESRRAVARSTFTRCSAAGPTDDQSIRLPDPDHPEFGWWNSSEHGILPSIKKLFDGTLEVLDHSSPSSAWSIGTPPEENERRMDPQAAAHELEQLVKCTQWLSTHAERQAYAHRVADPPAERERLLQHWARVTMFAAAAACAARRLAPGLEEFAARQQADALGYHGVALGRLDRFFEAHRRLNESQALLTLRCAPLDQLGVLDLRRAEVFVLEAQFANHLRSVLNEKHGAQAKLTKGQRMWVRAHLPEVQVEDDFDCRSNAHDLLRIVVARCDDAWRCLENAEDLMGGRTRSPDLWISLRVLRLHVFSVVPKSSDHATHRARFIHPVDLDVPHRLTRCVNDGIVAAPSDSYGKRRLLHHFISALRAHGSRENWMTFVAQARDAYEETPEEMWLEEAFGGKPKQFIRWLDEQGSVPSAAWHAKARSENPGRQFVEVLREHAAPQRKLGYLFQCHVKNMLSEIDAALGAL